MENLYDLSRFVEAQRQSYDTALEEVRKGHKSSHWMWYIFPQMKGLGHSYTSQYYAIESLDEAAAFLKDPYLGNNLLEICGVLLELETDNPTAVFGRPDDMKLRSCMTLFSAVSENDSVFRKVLDKYFAGKPDMRTLRILGMT